MTEQMSSRERVRAALSHGEVDRIPFVPFFTPYVLAGFDEARRDPDLFLDRGERLVIDEVQHSPDLLLGIKRRVDQKRIRGRYLLTSHEK